jgi:hypothetical protein
MTLLLRFALGAGDIHQQATYLGFCKRNGRYKGREDIRNMGGTPDKPDSCSRRNDLHSCVR